jgi:hypothetical protein
VKSSSGRSIPDCAAQWSSKVASDGSSSTRGTRSTRSGAGTSGTNSRPRCARSASRSPRPPSPVRAQGQRAHAGVVVVDRPKDATPNATDRPPGEGRLGRLRKRRARLRPARQCGRRTDSSLIGQRDHSSAERVRDSTHTGGHARFDANAVPCSIPAGGSEG